jgi:acyl dehydratase
MSKPKQIIPEKVIGFKAPPQKSKWAYIDCQVYALGIGFSRDQMKVEDHYYTSELKDDDFRVFPTNATTICSGSEVFNMIIDCPGMPEFNPMALLHGEQETYLYKPLKVNQDYISEVELTDVADKKKGALLTSTCTSWECDESGKKGDKACMGKFKVFIRGIGGFGFPGKDKGPGYGVPKTAPTKTMTQKTDPNQAIVYRLAGDFNPLHIDPDMAAMGGFDKPILHGLCFYGISAKLLVEGLCAGDETQLKSISARFTSHVFPGETLQCKMWVNGTKVAFETSTVERGLAVAQGVAELQAQPKL